MGEGSSDRALKWTTMALLLVFLTLTVFSSAFFGVGAAGVASSRLAAPEEVVVDEEDFLKRLLMKPLRSDFSERVESVSTKAADIAESNTYLLWY